MLIAAPPVNEAVLLRLRLPPTARVAAVVAVALPLIKKSPLIVVRLVRVFAPLLLRVR